MRGIAQAEALQWYRTIGSAVRRGSPLRFFNDMKALLCSLAALATLLVGNVVGQELVSTGIIAGLQPKEGTLTIRSDQTNGIVTFFGADKANIFTSDGQPYLLQNLKPGVKVTIQYAARGEKWYISKMILPPGVTPPEAAPAAPAAQAAPAAGSAGPQAAAVGATTALPGGNTNIAIDALPPRAVNGDPAALSKAANDGDITTNPGRKAAIDNDITTVPPARDVQVAPLRRR